MCEEMDLAVLRKLIASAQETGACGFPCITHSFQLHGDKQI